MPYPYDHPSTLHPFDLAVLNSNLKARGLAPVPGNEQWAAPARKLCPECWAWYDAKLGPCACLDDALEPEPSDPGPMDDLPDCEPDQIDR